MHTKYIAILVIIVKGSIIVLNCVKKQIKYIINRVVRNSKNIKISILGIILVSYLFKGDIFKKLKNTNLNLLTILKILK